MNQHHAGTSAVADLDAVVDLARAHDLAVERDTIRLTEAGLDYRVALARTTDGEHWVLRIPRRPDVAAGAAQEAATLTLVGEHLDVAVPQWRIRTPELIAYPQLPGEPGLTIDADGQQRWSLDLQSPRYADSFGVLLAQLHSIDVDQAREAGVPVQSPAQVRQGWRDDLSQVAAEFRIQPELSARWQAWLEEDSYWPDVSVMTHGELYPAHLLQDTQDRIVGVLDWTTAKVADPGRDFAIHHALSTPETFARTAAAYVHAGGTVWPRLAEHCAELIAAGPIGYGLYALQTGAPEHRAAAAAQLDPR